MHCSTMEPRYYCLYMMLRNERFKHSNPQNVEKERIFWGPSKNQSSIPNKPIFIEKWRYSWFLWLGSLTCYMYKLYRIIICFSFITKLERLNKKTIVEFTPVNSACVTWPCVVIQWTRVKEPGMSLDRCPSQVPAGSGGPT